MFFNWYNGGGVSSIYNCTVNKSQNFMLGKQVDNNTLKHTHFVRYEYVENWNIYELYLLQI
jgi:hypothetical protein